MKKLFFGLGITLAVLGAGCLPDKNTPSLNTTVSDTTNFTADEVATIMLNEVDVLGRVFAVRPEVIQFNGQLDEANDGSEYYVARNWLDELTGETAMSEAVTKYISVEQAEAQIIELAGDNERLQAPQPVGDTWVVYTTPASDTEPASVTYRMTEEQYGVRITVFDRGSDTQEDLLELANDLAATQLSKFGDALVLGVTLTDNAAIDYLPTDVAGADYLGTSFVTAEEWLGTIYDLDSEEIPGFVTGAVRRWQLQSRPNEVVEVVILEMESDEVAAEYVTGFLPSLPDATEITLPASIADGADAVVNGELVELQTNRENYVVDISIFAPLGVADISAAQDDLITISETMLGVSTTVTTTNTVSEYSNVTADQLALALLTPDDMATEVADAHPLPLEFNGQLDPNLVDYDFYLGRLWNDADGNMLVSNAVTRYTSVEAARANVTDLATACDQVFTDGVSDVFFVCYDDPLLYYGGPSDPASMIYRFTLGQYGVRLDLVDTGNVTDDDSVIYSRLDAILTDLALLQEQNLQAVLADTSAAVVATPAVTALPSTPDGTRLVGTGALTAEEWMTLTGDDASELNGFTSGAVRRWQIDARPDEVLEVIVMEFATAEQAEALAADFAGATADSGIAETQGVKDYFFYDITVFSPFGELDTAAADVDLATFRSVILE